MMFPEMLLQRLSLLLILLLSFDNYIQHGAEALSGVPARRRDDVIRYRARVAYDGNGFQGFQIQPNNRRTVQGDLEQVLSQRFQSPVRVVGAGRTDSGVHARGQAIHFELPCARVPTGHDTDFIINLEYSMNRMLQQDVRVYNVQKAPIVTKEINSEQLEVPWNAIHDSTGKLYIYRISAGKSMHPLERHNRYDLQWRETDVDVLTRTLKYFEGYHDFRAFAGGIEQLEKAMGEGSTMDTRRMIYNINVVDEGNDMYRIEIHLKGALYKMVRNMVGSALDVAWGQLSEEHFLHLLHRTDDRIVRKSNKSKPAPPEGLTLEKVYYDDF